MNRLLASLTLVLLAVPTWAADTVKVEFKQLPSGHITVPVKINGKGPYQLIFDTGAPVTLLNNRIAKDSGLSKGLKAPLFSMFGALGEVKIKRLDVGGQVAEGVAAMIMDHPTVALFNDVYAKKFGPIDGIVGFPFFARFKTTIDYQAKTLTFEPSTYQPPDVLKSVEKLIMDLATKGPDKQAKVLSPGGLWGVLPAKDAKDDEAGTPVKEVLPGSAAERAGIKAGDRVLTIDGRWTDSIADLFTAAGYVKAGTTAPVVVKRDGKEIELKVKPDAGL